MPIRVTVIADTNDSDSGFVGERLVNKHGAHLLFRDRDELRSGDTLEGDLVLTLGSARSVCDDEQSAVVETEAGLIRSALDAGLPVLGICYGAQLLAHSLGGKVSPSTLPEIGWYSLISHDPLLCPPGPWTQFHSDAFVAPPLARVLGTSQSGCQGFADESRTARSIGWQFHPEVTSARFITWVEQLRAYCESHGADPDLLIASAPKHERPLRRAAYILTDAAFAWLMAPRQPANQDGSPIVPPASRQS